MGVVMVYTPLLNIALKLPQIEDENSTTVRERSLIPQWVFLKKMSESMLSDTVG